MKLSEAGERRIIEEIRKIVRPAPGLITGLEDDAAIVVLTAGKYAFTTDMGTMGTHFLTKDPGKIGTKIVTSNATDLLAKGAVPRYALVSIGMPPGYDMAFIRGLYESMEKELRRFGAYIIGGDTNSATDFIYSVTMVGPVDKPLPRSGAKAGDRIVLTGRIGDAAAGYAALKGGLKADEDFVRAQLEPRIDFGLCRRLMPFANAGIDISDGLAFELGEMARLSGKKIVIQWEKLPLHPVLEGFCRSNGLSVEEIALHHGEDYQIAYAAPNPPAGFVIGEVREGSGLFLSVAGKERRLEPRGYEHFRS